MLTQTEDFGFMPNGSQQVRFEKFDDLADTRVLRSVEITLEYTKIGGSLAVDNDSAMPGTIDLQHTVNGGLSVVSGGISLLDFSFNPIGASLNAATSLHGVKIAASSGDSISEYNNTGLSDYFIFNPTNLTVSATGTVNSIFTSSYIAVGTADNFILNFGAFQTMGATGLGGLQQAYVMSEVQGFVTVTYHYDVAPEPSSILLGLAGAIGVGIRRRR